MQAQQGSSYRSAASGATEQEPSAATAGRQHHQANADDDEDDEPVERDPSGRSASAHIMASERAALLRPESTWLRLVLCTWQQWLISPVLLVLKSATSQQREASSSVQKLCSAGTLQS